MKNLLVITSAIMMEPVVYGSVSYISLTPALLGGVFQWSVFSSSFIDYNVVKSLNHRQTIMALSRIFERQVTCNLLYIESDETYWFSLQTSIHKNLHIILHKILGHSDLFQGWSPHVVLNKRFVVAKVNEPVLICLIFVL